MHENLATAAIMSKIREACFITLVETDSWQWYLPVGTEFGSSVWERFVRFKVFGKDFGEGMMVHCRGMGERMPDGVQKKGVGSNCLAGESV